MSLKTIMIYNHTNTNTISSNKIYPSGSQSLKELQKQSKMMKQLINYVIKLKRPMVAVEIFKMFVLFEILSKLYTGNINFSINHFC